MTVTIYNVGKVQTCLGVKPDLQIFYLYARVSIYQTAFRTAWT